MKFVKKNQIIIYVIALMLVTAGYLNYVSSGDLKSVSSSMSEEELVEMANIGDAQLVSNNDSNIVNDVDNSSNTDSNLVEKTNSIDNNMTEQTSSLVTNTDNKTNSDYFTSSKLERDSMYSHNCTEFHHKVSRQFSSCQVLHSDTGCSFAFPELVYERHVLYESNI